jgi:hypothetical protein
MCEYIDICCDGGHAHPWRAAASTGSRVPANESTKSMAAGIAGDGRRAHPWCLSSIDEKIQGNDRTNLWLRWRNPQQMPRFISFQVCFASNPHLLVLDLIVTQDICCAEMAAVHLDGASYYLSVRCEVMAWQNAGTTDQLHDDLTSPWRGFSGQRLMSSVRLRFASA